MKLGINTHFIMKLDFDPGLKFCQNIGVTAIEIAAMGPSAKKYCHVEKLLADKGELNRWLDIYAAHEIEIYSFSGHGTPLYPDPKVQQSYSKEFRRVCELMGRTGVTRMALVAGLPEACEGDEFPNWIVNTDLPFLRDALEWQWEKRLIPFWKEHGKIASDHGVTLCFEMQVLDMIHSPVKLRRLRDEVGPVVACNYDISHMWVQHIDPFEAIHYLGDLIQNVHLKDTLIHAPNCRLRGMFDTTSPDHYAERSWTFTIPGWGHGEQTWRQVITALRFIGYEGILSLEMEGDYIEIIEGLEKAASFMRPILMKNPPGLAWRDVTHVHELSVDKKKGG